MALMQIHINKGVFYSFKIKDRKRLESGILLVEGEDWVLISSIFSDYIVDGYMLINKKYITSIHRTEKEMFTEKVLKASDKTDIVPYIDIPHLSIDSLFKWLEDKHIVFQIDNRDENQCWIGKILDSTKKSIFLTPLTPKGEWDKSLYYAFRKANIRIISFNSDYINSLMAYNKKHVEESE